MTEPRDALLTGLERLHQDQILKDVEAINAAYVRLFITIHEQLKGGHLGPIGEGKNSTVRGNEENGL